MNIKEIREKYPMYSDMSDGELVRGLHKTHYQDMPYGDFLKRIDFSEKPVDPTEGMGFLEKFNAGAGKAFMDIGRGASQMVGKGPSAEEVRNTKALEAPLMNTGAGMAGNVAGNISLLAPASVIPGANAVAGAGVIGAGIGALQPTEGTAERLMNMGVGGGLGAGTQALAGPVARRIGEFGVNREASLQAQQSQNAVRDETLRMGREAGYVVPPSSVNPTATNRILETAGGRIATGQKAVERNAPITDTLARKVGGLGPDDDLSVKALTAARQGKMSQPYRDVSGLSQQASDDLAALQQARFDSKMAWKEYGRQGNRAAYSDATAADARVKELTQALEGHASSAGKPELVEALKQARKEIAQNRLVQESVNVGAGHADPSVFGKALDKGAPLSGDALTIARMQQAFPQFMKDASGQQAPGTNQLMGVLSGAGGFAAGGLPGMAASLLTPPAVRNAVLSKTGQGLLGTPNYSPGLLTQGALAMDDPETRRLLGLLMRAGVLPAIPQAVE